MRMELRPRRPWTVLAVLTIARIAYGVQFQSMGAVGPAMVQDLGLAYASLGTLIGAYSMLGLVLALPAGWLIARFGDRRIVLCGLGLMIAGGLLLAAAPGFGVAICGRLVSGAGAVLLMVALPTIIISLFNGAALSAAMGTLLSGYPLGIGLGFLLLPSVGIVARSHGCDGGACRGGDDRGYGHAWSPAGNVEATTTSKIRPGGKEVLAVVAAGLLWGSVNAGYAVLLGFGPVFFVGNGASIAAAEALVSLVALATVPTGPLGGWLVGRLPRPLPGISGGIIMAMVATGGLTLNVAPVVLLVAAGMGVGSIAGPSVTLPATVLKPEHRAVGMGLFWMTFFLLMTLLPALAGLARDLAGSDAAPLYAAAVFDALGLVAVVAYSAARRAIGTTVNG